MVEQNCDTSITVIALSNGLMAVPLLRLEKIKPLKAGLAQVHIQRDHLHGQHGKWRRRDFRRVCLLQPQRCHVCQPDLREGAGGNVRIQSVSPPSRLAEHQRVLGDGGQGGVGVQIDSAGAFHQLLEHGVGGLGLQAGPAASSPV